MGACASSAKSELATDVEDLAGGKQRRRASVAKVQNLLGIPTGPRLQGAGRARYEKALDAAYAKFVAVDADNSGTVDCREFCKAFNLEFNIFTQRLWRLFDLDGSGDISFREFLFGLSKFASKGVNDKVTFAFHLFDVDGSGSISADEFVAAFKQGYKSTAWGEQSQTVIGDGARSKFLDLVEQVAGSNGEVTIDAFRVLIAKHPSAFAFPFTIWNAMSDYSEAAGIVMKELERQGTVDHFLRDVAGRYIKRGDDPFYSTAEEKRSNGAQRGGMKGRLEQMSGSFRRMSGSFRRMSVAFSKAMSPSRSRYPAENGAGNPQTEYGSLRDNARDRHLPVRNSQSYVEPMQQRQYPQWERNPPNQSYSEGYNCSELNEDGGHPRMQEWGAHNLPYHEGHNASAKDQRFSGRPHHGHGNGQSAYASFSAGTNPEYHNNVPGGGQQPAYASNVEYGNRFSEGNGIARSVSGRVLDGKEISGGPRTVIQTGPLRKTPSGRRQSLLDAIYTSLKKISTGFNMNEFARGAGKPPSHKPRAAAQRNPASRRPEEGKSRRKVRGG